MKASCKLEIGMGDEKKVKTVLKSIKVDDFDFVKSKVEGNHLVA